MHRRDRGASIGRPSAPHFIVTPGGTAFPVPQGAIGPVPVLNQAGRRTGSALTRGGGGTNGQVATNRIMHPAAARGRRRGYPHVYIAYQNAGRQVVNPYTGRTGPRDENHLPIDR